MNVILTGPSCPSVSELINRVASGEKVFLRQDNVDYALVHVDDVNDDYFEPNEETRAALEEAQNRKEYDQSCLFSNVEDLMAALNAE